VKLFFTPVAWSNTWKDSTAVSASGTSSRQANSVKAGADSSQGVRDALARAGAGARTERERE
jgi:hypothetical protein